MVNSSASIPQELYEDISISQVYTACEQAQKWPDFSSHYSFSQKLFSIEYNAAWFPVDPNIITTPPNKSGKFHAQFQKKNWEIGIAVWDTAGEVLAAVSTLSKKEEPQKECAFLDMEDAFDGVKLASFCDAISNSKLRRGDYMLHGIKYAAYERMATVWPPATYFTPPQYVLEYPGHFSKEITKNYLHISDTSPEVAPTVQNLALWFENYEGANLHKREEWEHLFSEDGFIKLCAHIRDNMPGKKWEYELKGNKYPLWIKFKWLFSGYAYYAEIPGENNTTLAISAWSPEQLYKKIFSPSVREKSEK